MDELKEWVEWYMKRLETYSNEDVFRDRQRRIDEHCLFTYMLQKIGGEEVENRRYQILQDAVESGQELTPWLECEGKPWLNIY